MAETWQERLGKTASAEPFVYLGPIAGKRLTKEIQVAVRSRGVPEVLGGEEFQPLLAAEEGMPYSVWMMRFGEEGKRPSQQEWHRHVIPGKGTELPGHVSHRMLFLICSGGEAGVERCKVDPGGNAIAPIVHYSFKPDTLYVLRFDGDDIHRFTSEHKDVTLAAISFHPLDRDYGPQGMNSQTVIYAGSVPAETERFELPGLSIAAKELPLLDSFVKDAVLSTSYAERAGSEAVALYLEYLAMPDGEKRNFDAATNLVKMHKELSGQPLP